VPPELHQVINPYLEKVQQRLNPGYQANWPSGGQTPPQPSGPSGWQLPSWPEQPTPQIQWPQQPSTQPAWPAHTPPEREAANPYAPPREPRPFPDPYSSKRPASGTY
jgi:hypothetical protein